MPGPAGLATPFERDDARAGCLPATAAALDGVMEGVQNDLQGSPRRARRQPPSLQLLTGPLRLLAQRYARNLLVGTDLGTLRGDGGGMSVEARPLAREVVAAAGLHGPDDDPDFARDLARLVRESTGPHPVLVKGSPLERNVAAVMRAAALGRVEGAVLQFLATIHLAKGLEPLTDMLGPLTHGAAAGVVAVATGLPRREVAAALESRGRLAGSGLVSIEPQPGTVEQKFSLDLRLRELLSEPGLTVPRVRQAFLPRAAPPTLTPEDFGHVAQAVRRAASLLSAALARRERGINLLLHGPTGTGKSELSRVLARMVRAPLHAAGTVGPGGCTPSPPERLSSLLLGQQLLARTRALVLFDEVEDLFEVTGPRVRGWAAARMSKAWFNELLERNAVPTLWITNDPAVLDPAFLRRFSMSLALGPLDASRRRRVLARTGASRRGLGPVEELALAARFPVSAAELAGAVRVARLVGGGRVQAPVVEELLDASVRLVTGAPPPQVPAPAPAYRVDLVNASLDLAALAARLSSPAAVADGVTLCLHGPPGTGKSEYVRHLAERLGRPLLVRRVSEIESKFVGDAEKNLAAAFEEAERGGAILLFDEADSFLRDRSRATNRWEITLTNEFLQRLEGARGVVACTTNLLDELDKAVLRRFALRIGFDYLEASKLEAMFEAVLRPLLPPGLAPPDLAARLERCGRLAPGDFAVVARRARLLGLPITGEWLLGELALEAGSRGDVARRPAGFTAVPGRPAAVHGPNSDAELAKLGRILAQ